MKRLLSLLIVLTVLMSGLSVAAEGQEDRTYDNSLSNLLSGFGGWLSNAGEAANQALQNAAEWTENSWNTIQQTATDLADNAKNAANQAVESVTGAAGSVWSWIKDQWSSMTGVGSRMSGDTANWFMDVWSRLAEEAKRFFEDMKNRWESWIKTLEEFKQSYEQAMVAVVRISVREYNAMVEELAAAHGADIPEDVRRTLDDLQAKANGQPLDTEPDADVALRFLSELGYDEDSLKTLLETRLKKTILSICIQAESACLKEYNAEHQLKFSSSAFRAQDRLDRYAAGKLDLTDDQIMQASDMITEWAKENGVDIDALGEVILQRILEIAQ